MITFTLLLPTSAVPLRPTRQQPAMLMQKLHLMPGSSTLATYAQNAFFCSAYVETSDSLPARYLHRVYWLLKNADGDYLADIWGNQATWVRSANDVPERHRCSSIERIKERLVLLHGVTAVQDQELAITPVDFYAHCSTPHRWCAQDD